MTYWLLISVMLGQVPPDQLGLPEERTIFAQLCRKHESLIQEFRHSLREAMEDTDRGEGWTARKIGLLRDRDAIRRVELRLSILGTRRGWPPPPPAAELLPDLDWNSPSSIELADSMLVAAFKAEAELLAQSIRVQAIPVAVPMSPEVVVTSNLADGPVSLPQTEVETHVAPIYSAGGMAGSPGASAAVRDSEPRSGIFGWATPQRVYARPAPVAPAPVVSGRHGQPLGVAGYSGWFVSGVLLRGGWITAPGDGGCPREGPPVLLRGQPVSVNRVGIIPPARSIGGASCQRIIIIRSHR